MRLMFPTEVRKSITKLHIAYEAGLMADGIKQSSRMLTTTPPELDLLVKQGIGCEKPWTQNAVSFAKQYEDIVDTANKNGAEIYDTCVSWLHKDHEHTLLTVNHVLTKLKAKNIRVLVTYGFKPDFDTRSTVIRKEEVVCSNGFKDRIIFYTTSKGAKIVQEALREETSHKDASNIIVSYYAMSMQSKSLLSELLRHTQNTSEPTALCMNALFVVEGNPFSDNDVDSAALKMLGRVFSLRGTDLNPSERVFLVKDTSGSPYNPIDEALEYAAFYKMDKKALKTNRRYL